MTDKPATKYVGQLTALSFTHFHKNFYYPANPADIKSVTTIVECGGDPDSNYFNVTLSSTTDYLERAFSPGGAFNAFDWKNLFHKVLDPPQKDAPLVHDAAQDESREIKWQDMS